MEDADSGNQRARILRVATRCTSADQFVEAFARFCDGRALFVSSLSTRPIGTKLPFVILLADGTRAMRGQCEVIESYANPGNVYRRPGVKLALAELDDESEAMLTRLQRARAARDARTTGLHQAVSAAAIEMPEPARGSMVPSGLPPLPPPPSAALRSPPPPPGQSPVGGRVPALPPLPRLHGPGEPRKADSTALPGLDAPRRPAAAPSPPPPPDDTDAGWGDDDSRPVRAIPASEVEAAPAPVEVAPVEVDSSPAMIVGAVPDAAAAAAVAAADAMDGVPVVELVHRSQGTRRDTGGAAQERSAPVETAPASGRINRSGRHPTGRIVRPTPGDVYSGEERTPGSSFILPANPLSNLTDESLQGFIDCTIYEDPNAVTPPPPSTSDPAISGSTLGMVEEPEPDFRPVAPPAHVIELIPTPSVVVAPTPRPRATTGSMQASGEISIPRGLGRPATAPPVPAPLRPRSASQPLASVDDDEEDDELLPPEVAAPRVLGARAAIASAPTPLITPPRAATPTEAAARARASRPTPPPPLPLPPPPRSARAERSAPDWMAPAPSDPRPRVGTRPPVKKRKRGGLLAAVVVLAALATVVVLYLWYRERERRADAPSGGITVARDASVAGDAATGTGALGSGTAPAAVDAGTVAAPIIDAGAPASGTSCRLRLTTDPVGAAVTLGTRNLGTSPIDADVECGAATLTARLPRFLPGTRQLTLEPGGPADVKLKLARPPHALTILSTPKGATVWINGRPVGVTPVLSYKVSRFMRHALTIELKGYRVHRTTVNTDDEQQTVAVPLVKLP